MTSQLSADPAAEVPIFRQRCYAQHTKRQPRVLAKVVLMERFVRLDPQSGELLLKRCCLLPNHLFRRGTKSTPTPRW